MARIISFRRYEVNWVGYRTYTPLNGFVSINLETVLKLSSLQASYPHKKVKVKRSFLVQLFQLFKDEYDIVNDESKPYYRLKFMYKNRSLYEEDYLIDKEEYERLKPELARYGWII